MTEALETTFSNIKIGKVDKNGLELFNGDTIKIRVSDNVYHTGVIFYEDAAFRIKHESLGAFRDTPLCNYAPYCEIEKLK